MRTDVAQLAPLKLDMNAKLGELLIAKNYIDVEMENINQPTENSAMTAI